VTNELERDCPIPMNTAPTMMPVLLIFVGTKLQMPCCQGNYIISFWHRKTSLG